MQSRVYQLTTCNDAIISNRFPLTDKACCMRTSLWGRQTLSQPSKLDRRIFKSRGQSLFFAVRRRTGTPLIADINIQPFGNFSIISKHCVQLPTWAISSRILSIWFCQPPARFQNESLIRRLFEIQNTLFINVSSECRVNRCVADQAPRSFADQKFVLIFARVAAAADAAYSATTCPGSIRNDTSF